jgi:hypothetical protein
MKVALVCMVLMIVLTGCLGQANLPLSAVTPTAAPTATVMSSAPATIAVTPAVIPTPKPGTGTVIGQLAAAAPGQSMAGQVVYLGSLLPLEPGPGYLINVSPGQSPVAQVDPESRFLFSGVPPARYAIVLWAPHSSQMVPDPAKPGQELLITVVADQILDLGTLATAASGK